MSSRKSVETSKVNQITDGLAAVSLVPEDGPWEVSVKKSKNKASGKQNTVPRPLGQPASHDNSCKAPAAKAWPQIGSAGRGNIRPQLSSGRVFPLKSAASQPAISAPQGCGWNWNARPGASTTHLVQDSHVEPVPIEDDDDDDIDNDGDDDSDALDSDDDELLSDEIDSDASEASFESRKKYKWFKAFFKKLDKMTLEEINQPTRQWHCPACQNGPGAIEWYRLQPLITHARTKGSKRVKLHRELAELLHEELRQKGTSIVQAGEAFGKWKFPNEVVGRQIVWPPMVVIMNTKLEQDENDLWIGMGSPELRDLFNVETEVKARHSYGPHGHRGMSMLIFESSAVAYFEAECLSERFREQGTDREAWESPRRVVFCAGGDRQLYGFMAEKQDLVFFNQHMKGNSRLKYEMRSYQEVVGQLRKIAEENQQLIWCKNEWAKDKKSLKELKESYEVVCGKFRRVSEEKNILRKNYKVQHEQVYQEMDCVEEFFKKSLKNIAKDAKEDSFERLQQDDPQKWKQPNARRDDIEMEEFRGERDKIVKIHEEAIAAMKQRYNEELAELENKFNAQMNLLRSNFTLPRSC